jgi:hypothetical protein
MLPTDDKLRKALPIFTFLVEYFPDVIVELTKLCVQGNIQHNPELAPNDIKWAREKSTDQMNTAFRHMFDRARGVHFDSDGVRHIIKSVWRNMAQAQLDIEAFRDGLQASHAGLPREVVTGLHNRLAGQTLDCYPTNWPYELTTTGAAAGLEGIRACVVPEHKPVELCQCGFTVCKICQFP